MAKGKERKLWRDRGSWYTDDEHRCLECGRDLNVKLGDERPGCTSCYRYPDPVANVSRDEEGRP